MRAGATATVVALLLLSSVLALGLPGARAADPGVASTPVIGNITGPSVLAYNAHGKYTIDASGGPAFAANGTLIGNLTYYASVSGPNVTGVTVVPSSSGFVKGTAPPPLVTVTNISEVLTVQVEITSVYQTENVSLNLSYKVTVVQPYVLTLSIVSDSSSSVVAFFLTVALDGSPVGSISVPTLTPKQTYVATFKYATLGLSPGEHTFTVSFSSAHPLVTFAGGGSTYSSSFYIPGAPPDYSIWYVAGAVAFFGAIFIFVTRVAARRRNPARK